MPPRARRKPPKVDEEALTGVEEKIDNNQDGFEGVVEPKEASTTTAESQTKSQAEVQAESPTKPPTEQSKAWKRLLGSSSEHAAKKPRITKTPSAENNLKDSVRPGLILISIGLNPGIMTGKLGEYCQTNKTVT